MDQPRRLFVSVCRRRRRVTLRRQPCGTPSTFRTPQRQMMAMVMGAMWRVPWRERGTIWRCWVRRVSRGKPVRLTLHVPCRVEWRVAGERWRATMNMAAVAGTWTGEGLW